VFLSTVENIAIFLYAFVFLQMKVHSLTARSMSREFREGLRLSAPKVSNSNIKLPAKEEDVPPNNSSGAIHHNGTHNNNNLSSNNNNNEEMTSAVNLIKSRAAFWDQRVNNSILNDELVIDKFPVVSSSSSINNEHSSYITKF